MIIEFKTGDKVYIIISHRSKYTGTILRKADSDDLDKPIWGYNNTLINELDGKYNNVYVVRAARYIEELFIHADELIHIWYIKRE